MRFSRLPTQLPHQATLGDVRRMVAATFASGVLLTPEVPKNELWEAFSKGMLGPTMDLIAPGLNPLVEAALHGAIETTREARGEARERTEYGERTLFNCICVPYLDILELDWREMGSFWSLSMQGPVRHLTFAYRDPLGTRDIATLIPDFSFKEWIPKLFRRRYNCDVLAEHQAVIDSMVDPAVYAPMFFQFNQRHPAPTAADIEELKAEFVKTRAQYLTDRGITNEEIRTKSIDRCTALLERYRGLPEAEAFLKEFLA